MLKLTFLNDNRCNDKNLECEHGLSILIEDDNKKVLFDVGQTDIFMKNATKLGISLDDVETIVLSHGDYDHGNGLKYFTKKANLICHPDFMKERISKRTGKFDGLNQDKETINIKFNLIETKIPYSISNNIIFLGEIERTTNFEKGKNLPMFDSNGDTYKHFDDSGIVIKTEDGIIVISGCAHSGICNTVEYAKKITNDNRVLSVIGGFHLKESDNQTLKTIEYMKNNGVESIILAHCTSDIVCQEFLTRLPEITSIAEVGKTFTFSSKKILK